MVQMQDVTVFYKKKKVLDHICLEFKKESYGILGPNGAGKTTLFRTITGSIKPKKGMITYENKKAAIGYLPQKFGCMPELTVKEQLQYICYLKGIEISQEESEISRVLKIVNMDDRANQKCRKLSGGMIRRIGIAQSILGHPDLVLLDEPTAGLDIEERNHFYGIFKELEGNCPVLISSHIAEDILLSCQNTVIMKEGKIMVSETTKGIAPMAKGKVFLIREADAAKLNVYHLIRTEEVNGQRYLRILTEKEPNVFCLEPQMTLEDGYFVCLYGL